MSFGNQEPEPRKIFLGFLITRLMEVEEAIYNSPTPRPHSIIMLKGIIDSLDSEDKTAMQPQLAKLLAFRNNHCKDTDIEQVYSEISNYLHIKYLQEFLRARVDKDSFKTLEEKSGDSMGQRPAED